MHKKYRKHISRLPQKGQPCIKYNTILLIFIPLLHCIVSRRLKTNSIRRRQTILKHDTQTRFLLMRPWSWSDDLDIRTWRRYFEVVRYKNEYSRSRLSNIRALQIDRQTDKQTDRHTYRCDSKHHDAAFLGGENTEDTKTHRGSTGPAEHFLRTTYHQIFIYLFIYSIYGRQWLTLKWSATLLLKLSWINSRVK